MKKLLSIILVFTMLFAMVACSNTPLGGSESGDSSAAEDSAANGESGENKIKKIGLAIDDISTDFGSNIVKGVTEACESYGIELDVRDSQGVSNTQISQVENMITAGCQAIVLKPGDISALEPLSLACTEANVPLVVLTTPIGSEYTSAVVLNNEEVGAAKAHDIIDNCGEDCKVAMLLGPLSNENGNIMQDAARKVFEEQGIEIVIENVGENKRDKALTVVENWISSGYEFDAIWASNDASALGAAQALKEAGIKEDVYVIGTGGNLEGLQGIQNGDLDATLYTPPTIFAQYGVDLAVQILNGETVEKDFTLPCIVINEDNVEEYIAQFQ